MHDPLTGWLQVAIGLVNLVLTFRCKSSNTTPRRKTIKRRESRFELRLGKWFRFSTKSTRRQS